MPTASRIDQINSGAERALFKICAQLTGKLTVSEMHRTCQINHEIIPKMPSRCTVEQYDRLCYDKNRHAEKQQMMADTVLK